MSKAKQELNAFVGFVRSQGVVGLAIAFVLGVAVKDTVDIFVSSIINPFIALFISADRLSEATFTIGESEFLWGSLLASIINLLVVAAVIYFVFKKLNLEKLDKKSE